ncbi:MAG: hypothetical protein AAFW81_03420 [Pseudomonadota bacterium]
MIRMSKPILSAVSAAGFASLAGPAMAAGGSEDGALSCAYAAVDVTGRDYTHVTRSVRTSHAIEEFWLATRGGDGPLVYCRYNNQDDAVEILDVEV